MEARESHTRQVVRDAAAVERRRAEVKNFCRSLAASAFAAGVALLASGCLGSAAQSSSVSDRAKRQTPVPSSTNPGSSAPPVYIGRYQARGVLSDEGTVRVSQDSAHDVPSGQHHQLLDLRGIGTLTLSCIAHSSGTIRLTTWARGEGPPVVQHVETHPTRPMALVPYPAAGGPVNLPQHSLAHQTFEYWQITIITAAFSANATILGLITQTQSGCDLSAEATVISHGQFYRYAH